MRARAGVGPFASFLVGAALVLVLSGATVAAEDSAEKPRPQPTPGATPAKPAASGHEKSGATPRPGAATESGPGSGIGGIP